VLVALAWVGAVPLRAVPLVLGISPVGGGDTVMVCVGGKSGEKALAHVVCGVLELTGLSSDEEGRLL